MIFVALLALSFQLYSTAPIGVGVSHDSILYLITAENISDGEGAYWTGGGGELKPLIHFPPLYPLLLAFGSSLAGSRMQIAAWSAASLFGASVLLAGAIIFYATGSWRAAILGETFFALSPPLFEVHLEAMSEPLYLTLTLSALFLLTSYLNDQKRWKGHLSALISSLAFLTRYIGASLAATGVIALLLFYPGSKLKKIREALRFGAIAIAANFVWTMRNFSLTGSFTNRVFAIHPIGEEKINEAITTLSGWLLYTKDSLEIKIMLAAFIILLAAGIVLSILFHPGRSKSRQPRHTKNVFLLHGILFGFFLLFSLTFFDASTRLNSRILSPLYGIALVLLFVEGHSILKPRLRVLIEKPQSAFIAIGLLGVLFFASTTLGVISVAREQGRGFNSRAWQGSEIIAKLRAMQPDPIIYTNEAFAVLYLTGIPALRVPEKVDPVDGKRRENYEELLAKMKRRLLDPNSALAVFHQGYLRPGMPSLDEMSEGLIRFHQSSDGIIYTRE